MCGIEEGLKVYVVPTAAVISAGCVLAFMSWEWLKKRGLSRWASVAVGVLFFLLLFSGSVWLITVDRSGRYILPLGLLSIVLSLSTFLLSFFAWGVRKYRGISIGFIVLFFILLGTFAGREALAQKAARDRYDEMIRVENASGRGPSIMSGGCGGGSSYAWWPGGTVFMLQ